MSTNRPEDQGTPPIPFPDESPSTTGPNPRNVATLDKWQTIAAVIAGYASTETHKPQLMGAQFRPADPADEAARFTVYATDSFGLARITVPAQPDTFPTVDAVIPAAELATAVAAAVKAHGRREASSTPASLTVDPAAETWTFATETTRSTGRVSSHEFPAVTALAATLDTMADGTAPFIPTGFDAARLAGWINTAKKAGATLIQFHQWTKPTSPLGISYTTRPNGPGYTAAPDAIHVAALAMPVRIPPTS